MSLDTVVQEAASDATAIAAEIKPAVSDIKTLIANRAADVVLAAVILAAVWLGHAL